eukprot:9544529-Ditylum_brightwellii.AAC.1
MTLIPETNTPWTSERKSKYRTLGAEVYGNFKFEGASSDDPCTGNYQPGGVAMIAGCNAVGGICKSRVNELGLGRWVYACLNDQYNKKIWVIGAYRLGNNWSTGDETAYQQQ